MISASYKNTNTNIEICKLTKNIWLGLLHVWKQLQIQIYPILSYSILLFYTFFMRSDITTDLSFSLQCNVGGVKF